MSDMAGSESNQLFVPRTRAPVQLSPDKDSDRTTLCITFAKLACENVLSHPFTVIRRQSQVHGKSYRRHLVPITLLSPCYAIYQRQGIPAFWKGLGSAVFVRGFTLGVEDFFSKVTPWPKEISSRSTLKGLGQHFMLKCVSAAATTPLIAASLVELVQSDIASEKPGIFDVFREGFFRLVSWTTPQTGRLLPIWILVLPSTVTSIFRYMISLIATGISEKILKRLAWKSYSKYGVDVSESEVAQSPVVELGSWYVGRLISDVAFYPVDTVLHRLYLQGTRTIIDNLDDGVSVVPIVTRYEGFWDCWRSVVAEEGYFGLYKGFGALVLQYTAEFMFLRAVHFLVSDVYGSRFRTSPSPVVTQKTRVERIEELEFRRAISTVEPHVPEPIPSTSAEPSRMWRSTSLDFPDSGTLSYPSHRVNPAARPGSLNFTLQRESNF